jgi:hypothetical protein
VYHPPRPSQGAKAEKTYGPAGCVVSRVLFRPLPGPGRRTAKAIYLDPALRTGSAEASSASGLPATHRSEPHHRRCLALHPVGFTVPAASRSPRCALTAPFHPYRRAGGEVPRSRQRPGGRLPQYGPSSGGPTYALPRRRRYVLCGTFPIPERRSRRRNRNGGRYPPPWLSGARTFLPPHMRGRKSPGGERPSTQPAIKDYTPCRPRWPVIAVSATRSGTRSPPTRRPGR